MDSGGRRAPFSSLLLPYRALVTSPNMFQLPQGAYMQGAGCLSPGVQDDPGQHGETPSLLKIQKITWAWWHVPVIPATQEGEAGEFPEPRRRRLR